MMDKPNYEPPFALPKFSFIPSKANLFQLQKHTRSLFPHIYRKNDSMGGYVGYLGAHNKVTHDTFPRYAPRKLYKNVGDKLLPPTRGSEKLPKLKTRKNKKKATFRNPFHLHDPSPETFFLVSHEKHGKRPTIRHSFP
jgi:hypothetical protein